MMKSYNDVPVAELLSDRAGSLWTFGHEGE